MLSHMVVKHICSLSAELTSLRVVLSHMVVKQVKRKENIQYGLRVVLSHMVVKYGNTAVYESKGLRVVLSHMVVKFLCMYLVRSICSICLSEYSSAMKPLFRNAGYQQFRR